jgi:hypothetical protein
MCKRQFKRGDAVFLTSSFPVPLNQPLQRRLLVGMDLKEAVQLLETCLMAARLETQLGQMGQRLSVPRVDTQRLV